jgi:hypothetical protein
MQLLAIIRKWKADTAKTPVRIRTKKGEPAKFKALNLDDPEEVRRLQASTNRVLTILKAALNEAGSAPGLFIGPVVSRPT